MVSSSFCRALLISIATTLQAFFASHAMSNELFGTVRRILHDLLGGGCPGI
jgi:hypothetical protein